MIYLLLIIYVVAAWIWANGFENAIRKDSENPLANAKFEHFDKQGIERETVFKVAFWIYFIIFPIHLPLWLTLKLAEFITGEPIYGKKKP